MGAIRKQGDNFYRHIHPPVEARGQEHNQRDEDARMNETTPFPREIEISIRLLITIRFHVPVNGDSCDLLSRLGLV